jgi:class 3 adenylate cyclase
VLREYHAEIGKLILGPPGTLERFTGDGMMIFFNDPNPRAWIQEAVPPRRHLALIGERAVKRCCALAGASPAWGIVGAPQ